MKIPVLMTTDDKYIYQAYVVLYSMCKNSSCEDKFEVTVLCDVTLEDKFRNRLLEITKLFSNISVNFYEVNPLFFINASSDYYVPVASFYRLICADVINDDKAVFLDSDLVVNLDIAELYEIDIEGYYLAGVKDIFPIQYPNFARDYARDNNLAGFEDYINCGVLLMNLDMIRRDGLVQKFLDGIKDNNRFVDQDILNRVCHGNIKILPWRFNMTPRNTEEEFDILLGTDRGEGSEIVHYCGPDKPWGGRKCYRDTDWWEAAQEALSESEYNRLLKARDVCYGKMQVYQLAEKCAEHGGPVVIAGYSDHGQFIRYSLEKYGITERILFCDNDPAKRNLYLGNDSVFTPEELADSCNSSMWINAVQEYRDAIDEQLLSLGVSWENILHYHFIEDNGCSIEHLLHSYIKWAKKNRKTIPDNNLNNEKSILIDAFDGVGWGGMEMWSYRVAEGLKNRGNNVVVYGNDDQIRQDKWEELILRLTFSEERADISFEVINRIYEDMRKRLPFVLINNWSRQVLVAAILLKYMYPDDIRIITIVHNEVDFLYNRIKEFYEYMDAICCVSSRIRKSLIRKLHISETKITNHNNFVVCNTLNHGIDRKRNEPLRIIFAGRLESIQKRADLLPELIRILDERSIDYQLDIAGDGDYLEPIDTWVKNMRKEGHIRVLGYIEQGSLESLFEEQHLFVNLSEYEGQSLAMLEAMSKGVVPVVTRVSGTEDIIKDREHGILTSPGNLTEIADAIEYLYGHEDIRRLWSGRCCERIKADCSFEGYIDYMEKLICQE